MPFQNRLEAAELLARKLGALRADRPLVLAIPRGAVPMGRVIADALDGELDVVLVRKLGAPGNPELAVGSVDESGHMYVAEHARAMGISDRYLERERQAQIETMRKRRSEYTPVRAPIDPAGRVVIVVDDGTATGSTMIAALRAVRARHPKKLIAAIGVSPPETLARLRSEADEVACLEAPEFFYAVGQFFADFPQVSDQEVIECLRHPGAGKDRN
jgi:predicted phosphoribosyltransferase